LRLAWPGGGDGVGVEGDDAAAQGGATKIVAPPDRLGTGLARDGVRAAARLHTSGATDRPE
jgi:hypothetical protein